MSLIEYMRKIHIPGSVDIIRSILNVAAPQHAQFNFVGLQTKKTYAVDAYLSDVANAYATWDSGSGASATSDNFWIPPEPVVLTDVSFTTGLTDTKRLQLIRNAVATGQYLNYGVHDDANIRPTLRLGFNKGDKIAGIQLA
jgi:hypothetical protein